ncbi:MAG: hypothetical protein PHC52_00625 [Syntrophales bacterium]|nr:hypothetical protein [Syntrophales bacterium]
MAGATLGTFVHKDTLPGPGQMLVRADHPASKGMARQGNPFYQIVTEKGLASLEAKGYKPVIVRQGDVLPKKAPRAKGKARRTKTPAPVTAQPGAKQPPAARPSGQARKSLFPPPAVAGRDGQASIFGGKIMGDGTVILGRGKGKSKSRKKAGTGLVPANAGGFARRGDPVPPGKVMVKTLHPLYRKGEVFMVVNPETVRQLKADGLRPVVVSGMPSAGSILGQAESRVYSPWLVLAGAATGHVGFTAGATLLEALPNPDGTLAKLVPWIEVGTGTLNILFAYLLRGNSFAFGACASGVALIPRGVGLVILRLLAARGTAMTPGRRGSAGRASTGQFTPEEEEKIKKAEAELLGKLQAASSGRARVGATPQVSMANIQPDFLSRMNSRTMWS